MESKWGADRSAENLGLKFSCSENIVSTGNQNYPAIEAIISHFDFVSIAIHSKALLAHGTHLKEPDSNFILIFRNTSCECNIALLQF